MMICTVTLGLAASSARWDIWAVIAGALPTRRHSATSSTRSVTLGGVEAATWPELDAKLTEQDEADARAQT
jgi:hypothetical protein